MKTYDKNAKFNIGISLTGPQVGIEQQQHRRSLTQHEKIKMLTDHLNETAQINSKDSQFRLKDCDATRIFVPPRSDSTFPGLSIWFSQNDETTIQSSLTLMENFSKNDSLFEFTEFNIRSPKSVLNALIHELEEELEETIITPELLLSLEARTEKRFTKNPVGLLQKLGAKIGSKRRIRTLYRIRDILDSSDPFNDPAIHVIAYPIFISEA